MANPQQAALKWANRTKGATNEYRQGISAVTESPMVKAAAAADKYLNRVQEAVNSGKFAERLRNTSIDKWKSNALEKGAQRIAAGVDGSVGDVEDFYSELFPFQERLASTVDAMPDATIEDSINRMVAWTRGMAEFHRS